MHTTGFQGTPPSFPANSNHTRKSSCPKYPENNIPKNSKSFWKGNASLYDMFSISMKLASGLQGGEKIALLE